MFKRTQLLYAALAKTLGVATLPADDNGGVHINSGIPNRAFCLAALALGWHSWEKAGQIWYDSLVDHNLKANASFATFANLRARRPTREDGTSCRSGLV